MRTGFAQVVFSALALLLVADVAYCDECIDYYKKKDYEKAISICSEYINAGGKGKGLSYNYWVRGLSYRWTKNYEKAQMDLSKTLEIGGFNDKQVIGLLQNRAIALLGLGAYDKALSDYLKALELDPNNPHTNYSIACTYALKKDADNACIWLQKALDVGWVNAKGKTSSVDEAKQMTWADIKNDSDLNNIRNSACYNKIMAGK